MSPRAATSTDVAPSRTVAPPEPPGNTASSRFGGFLEAIETVPQVLIPGSGSGARGDAYRASDGEAANAQPVNHTYVVSVEDLETLISEARHLASEEDASDRLPVVVDEGMAQGSPHLRASSIYDLGERSPRPALHRSGARTDQAEAALTDICEGVGRPIADRPRTEARNGSQCSTDTVQSFGRRRRGWIARPECGRRDPSCQ